MVERPLWKLLLELAQPDALAKRPLSCTECFAILEYLAENLARGPASFDQTTLRQAATHHLAACPDCNAYYRRRLQEMEQMVAENEE